MKYTDVLTMRKQASKWLPFVEQFGTTAQKVLARQARAIQKSLEKGWQPRQLQKMNFSSPRIRPAYSALEEARQLKNYASRHNMKLDQTVPELYKILRTDASTQAGAKAWQPIVDALRNDAYAENFNINGQVNTADTVLNALRTSPYTTQPVTLDNQLLSARQYADHLEPGAKHYMNIKLNQFDKARKQLSKAKPQTAKDILDEFGTNNLLFHGATEAQGRNDWLRDTKGSPVWLSPLAPVSAGYATRNMFGVSPGHSMHVFAIPTGKLGQYTETRFTPHLSDGVGDETEAIAKGRIQAAQQSGRGHWGAQDNYEFVLKPNIRNKWLAASNQVHKPKTYYIQGSLPEDVDTRDDILPGLLDPALDNLKFYDADAGEPRFMYDQRWRRVMNGIVHDTKDKVWPFVPRFTQPDDTVIR